MWYYFLNVSFTWHHNHFLEEDYYRNKLIMNNGNQRHLNVNGYRALGVRGPSVCVLLLLINE